MIGFSGKCTIVSIDFDAKTRNGKNCVKVLIMDPNNKSQWYRGDLISFYGDDNRKALSGKKVGDFVGVQTSCRYGRNGWDVFFSVYDIKG